MNCFKCHKELASSDQCDDFKVPPGVWCRRLGCNFLFCPDCYADHMVDVHKLLLFTPILEPGFSPAPKQ